MRPTLRLLAWAATLSLATACSILPKTEPVDTYRLPVNQPSRTASALDWSLRLNKPLASEVLATPRIAVIPQGDVISSYKGARWSDPAPLLIRNRLLDGFQRDGRVQRLSADDSNLQADYELAGELQAFQSEYRAQDTVEVVVRYDARLVDGRSQRILASHRFEVRQPLADKQVSAVVAGFGNASDQLVGQVVNWTVTQAGQAQAKNQ
ncbi:MULTISPECIES: ABC-type transport auxiliary lipoprotein family protein [Pseudomonas]|uniref:ABC-type transport auxiliary lipoprotein component domain-containing protein n=2 Tax=Pseudomonas TaxID=286 RepID=A0AAX0VTW6_9PSED|nr:MULTISPECIES: ABC-type transport auxiliary lipoprotein family protein [Pseudomonas]MBH3356525.1 membrane integrity-associated transporter subunit PqiC [Pseudomonas guariconensis]MCO7623676.1 ABC-type transport auxiliary lipoprotein family protein [Pseudomonas guariconensis]MEB3841986.1 ABC-type transport auxiliary lipoprotein family protein [Pseudomonas guariconensis]MEB3874854.1 ABC-type transport auxiliary lipoprotein family protein [Pseudomonas guariconensis]MEB3878993.1 ABC-type transpo